MPALQTIRVSQGANRWIDVPLRSFRLELAGKQGLLRRSCVLPRGGGKGVWIYPQHGNEQVCSGAINLLIQRAQPV